MQGVRQSNRRLPHPDRGMKGFYVAVIDTDPSSGHRASDPAGADGFCRRGASGRRGSKFFQGRASIVEFPRRKWAKEYDYRLIKELWAFHGNRIAVGCFAGRKGLPTKHPWLTELSS